MRWLQLEANPEVFSEYGLEIGMSKSYKFIDLFTFDLSTLNEVYGFDLEEICTSIVVVSDISLFDTLKLSPIDEKSSQMIFIKQTIENSCGAIALLHTLCNNSESNSSILSLLRSFSSATDRGNHVEQDSSLCEIHKKYAQQGDTETPDMMSDTNLHFISIVNIDNQAIWLDGRKETPLQIGTINEKKNSFIKFSLKTLENLIGNNPNVPISVMAFCNN